MRDAEWTFLQRVVASWAVVAGLACGPDPHWSDRIEGDHKPDVVLQRADHDLRVARADLDRKAGARVEAMGGKRVLFGDLHVHSSYSWDAFLFTLPMVGGEGAHPPADACDFARFCANLDFFALTDHAESLLPEHWAATKESLRECNARAGDPTAPDLVAFAGFEWSQAGLTPESHWGHRCVIFADTAESQLPARPIGAADRSELYDGLASNMKTARWLQPLEWGRYGSFIDYLSALSARRRCASNTDVRLLPADCEEIAPDPAALREKLDQWGFDALVIPHGTAWGIYTPVGASIAKQLDPRYFDPERQLLVELMSGHGSSEEFRSYREPDPEAGDAIACPEPSSDFLPCCWQAGEIMRSRCGELSEAECEARVLEARQLAAQAYTRPQQVFPDAPPEAWLDCDQCRDCFKPPYAHRPKESVQFAMAQSREQVEGLPPLRFRWGFVASSDGHTARPGTGYKQVERSMMTDAVGDGSPLLERLMELGRKMDDPQQPQAPRPGQVGIAGNDMRTTSFLYPGGLAAVHSEDRSRDAIWRALKRREVYGTSGPRILLWFDLLNDPEMRAPMGSQVALVEAPRFEVRAVGSFEQMPGCPNWTRGGLTRARIERLCRNECYNPSDQRRRIAAIEVVRIRPQRSPDEPVAPLIEDPWRVFECEPDPSGCVVRFEDSDFADSGRDALYYVRALEEPAMAINGAPLSTRFDEQGAAIETRPCLGPGSEDGCPAPVQERAWSSPIFVDYEQSP